MVDYRESLVRDRTAAQNRLRWRLHELVPGYDPPAGSLNRYKTLAAIDELLDNHTGVVADLARREVTRIRELTREANQLETDITGRVTALVPSLLATPAAVRSPPASWWVKPPTSPASNHVTPTPCSPGQHRSRCGPPTWNGSV